MLEGDCVKGRTEVPRDDTCSLSLLSFSLLSFSLSFPSIDVAPPSQKAGVGQAGLALGEAMLAVPNHLPVLHVP